MKRIVVILIVFLQSCHLSNSDNMIHKDSSNKSSCDSLVFSLEELNWRKHKTDNFHVIDLKEGATFSEFVRQLYKFRSCVEKMDENDLFQIFGKPDRTFRKPNKTKFYYKVVKDEVLSVRKQDVCNYTIVFTDSNRVYNLPKAVIVSHWKSDEKH